MAKNKKRKKNLCVRCDEPCKANSKFCSETCFVNNMVSVEPWRVVDD